MINGIGVFSAIAILALTLILGGQIAVAANEVSDAAPCVSCDVILVNEYPESRID